MQKFLLCPALILSGCASAAQGTGSIEIKPVTGKATAATTVTAAPSPTSRPSPAASADPGASVTPSLPPEQQGALDAVARASGMQIRAIHKIEVQSSKGTFTLTLFPDQAPKAAAKFLSLAGKGVYDGTTFHRVIPGFVAQGGDPQSKTLPPGDPRIGYGVSGDDVPDDFANGLKHLTGSVALAHDDRANSSNCQFYICLADQPSLDNRYIVFGHVLSGMAVVQTLNPTTAGSTPDKIVKATVLE